MNKTDLGSSFLTSITPLHSIDEDKELDTFGEQHLFHGVV